MLYKDHDQRLDTRDGHLDQSLIGPYRSISERRSDFAGDAKAARVRESFLRRLKVQVGRALIFLGESLQEEKPDQCVQKIYISEK